MFGLPLAFAAPAVLAALIGLVGLYFLLRVTPPSPHRAIFPPLRLLLGLNPIDTTPARTPWPILALRLAIGALIILAMAEPLWNSLVALSGSGPLLRRTRRRTARQIRCRRSVALAGAGSIRSRSHGGATGDRALSRPRTEDRHAVDRGRGRARRGELLFDAARVSRPFGRGRDRWQRRARAGRRRQ